MSEDHKRGVGLVRLIQMQRELRARWMTVAQLAKHFNVHRRTIWRDLDVLREAGVPLQKTDPQPGQETKFRVSW